MIKKLINYILNSKKFASFVSTTIAITIFFIGISGFIFWLRNPELSQMQIFLRCFGWC